MIKILISSVGNHDPRGANNVAGPVLSAVEELSPDILFLFPTRKQGNVLHTATEENSKALVEELKEQHPDIKVYERPLNLPDPTDYKTIIKQLTVEIEEIKAQYSRSETAYYISVSSGTPQIQASFLVLTSSNRIKARAYQVVDPRFLAEGEARVRPMETHFIEENNQVTRAREYFQRFNFEASAHELASLACYTVYPEREKRAETFYDLLTGYFYWDLYQHREAKKHLENSYKNIQRYGFKKLSEILGAQLKILDEIINIGDVENVVNLFDLYHNAERRLLCKQYVDCLSRFKRIFEGVFYFVARKDLKIDARINLENQPEVVRKEVKKKRGFLYTHDISKLHEKRMNRRIITEGLEKQLNDFAFQRNNTINNHGMNSVSASQAKQALELAAKLLTKIFPDHELAQYPFSKQALGEVGLAIFEEL